MKTKILISVSSGPRNEAHDAFVNANKPNERCPLDSFMHKILNSSHGGVVTNDMRALPVVTYSLNGKYIAWFDTSEDIGYLAK